MATLRSSGIALVLAALVLTHAVPAFGVPDGIPDPAPLHPDGNLRAPRTDYLKTWYIFSDENSVHGVVNGILDPGDKYIDEFKNWWTPISSHSQHNMSRDYGSGLYEPEVDIGSGPINGAASVNPGLDNYWLPREPNAIHFYMTYSQFDNGDWMGGYDNGQTGDTKTIMTERHQDRNGWALGWVTHEKNSTPGNLPQTPAGTVKMDIFVHNGRGLSPNPDGSVDVPGFGKSYSNPELSLVNDINEDARDFVGSTGSYHPLQFDGDTPANGYSWAENQVRMNANFDGTHPAHGPALSDPQQQVVMSAMEVFMETNEYDPTALGNPDVIIAGKHPNAIAAGLVDHNGNPYIYEDAFLERSTFHDEATDGAVIAGLAGEENYIFDPQKQLNTYGDQQVIRIDIDMATLAANNIDKIIFYDFTDQLNPSVLTLDVKNFPDGRFYIAMVDVVPEPASAVLLVMGGVVMLVRSRKRRK